MTLLSFVLLAQVLDDLVELRLHLGLRPVADSTWTR